MLTKAHWYISSPICKSRLLLRYIPLARTDLLANVQLFVLKKHLSRMNLSVDPRAVALYTDSPRTQLSKYAPPKTNATEAPRDQKASRKGLMRRVLRRRKRGRVQVQKKPTQSVKPKSSWETQSLSVLITGLREKREGKGNVVQSISSWDDDSNNICSIINESSVVSWEEKELSAAPTSVPNADKWDARSVESEDVDADDIKSCRSDASSVVVWDSICIERQKVVPVVDRDLRTSTSSALVKVPDPTVTLLSNTISTWKADKPKNGVKCPQGGLRRLGNIISSSGNKKGEDLAVNLMVNDTFLIYQANTRSTQSQSASP